jgi:hypothetical protein
VNLSTSGLVQAARQDVVARQLATTASSSGISYDPTSRARVANHEIDKQSEDNQTWFFEYRALLNSKLTTLTTSLTSAYTVDMDASMGAQGTTANGLTWGAKNAMQGNTGQKFGGTTAVVDPGAARTADAYFSTYGNPNVSSTGTWDGNPTSSGNATEGATAFLTFAGNGVAGSTTFLTGGRSTFVLDTLGVDLTSATSPVFSNAKSVQITGAGFTSGSKIGNQLELTLYKFFAKPENFDILRFGLFQNVFVVGTSSLPTGSQVQGSIRLDWDQNLGKVNLTQERYAAFFHS